MGVWLGLRFIVSVGVVSGDVSDFEVVLYWVDVVFYVVKCGGCNLVCFVWFVEGIELFVVWLLFDEEFVVVVGCWVEG